jgi:hypothetical protein
MACFLIYTLKWKKIPSNAGRLERERNIRKGRDASGLSKVKAMVCDDREDDAWIQER